MYSEVTDGHVRKVHAANGIKAIRASELEVGERHGLHAVVVQSDSR